MIFLRYIEEFVISRFGIPSLTVVPIRKVKHAIGKKSDAIYVETPQQTKIYASSRKVARQICAFRTGYDLRGREVLNCSKKLKHHFFRPSVKLRKNIVEA